MGQAKQKKTMRNKILSSGAKCIYCGDTADTIDHMPPKLLFINKIRPKGMEYACCKRCNAGTKGAESVAGVVSRISEDDDYFDWRSNQGRNLIHALSLNAPNAVNDIFNKGHEAYRINKYGTYSQFYIADLSGISVSTYLDVFSAKLGLALFYEHTGRIIPDDGFVFSFWMTNKEAAKTNADAMFNILPDFATLENGRNTAESQFGYRFNTNKTTIVAAMSYFNDSLFISNIACTIDFAELEAPLLDQFHRLGTASIIRKGQLTSYQRTAG